MGKHYKRIFSTYYKQYINKPLREIYTYFYTMDLHDTYQALTPLL